MILSTFISFGYQDEYLIPLQRRFKELNEKDDSKLDEYIKLEKDIEASEMNYCIKEQNAVVYYFYFIYCDRERIKELQTDDKYQEVMTQSCILYSILSKSQSRLLQSIMKCESDCPVDEKREAISYLQYTIDKLEKRRRANDIKKKLIEFLYIYLSY